MVKHTQTIRRQQPANCLSVFDHLVKLALKGFKSNMYDISMIWDEVFKNRPSKICGRQSLKILYHTCLPQILLGPFLNTLPHIKPFGDNLHGSHLYLSEIDFLSRFGQISIS